MSRTILSFRRNLIEHRFDVCQFYAAKLLYSTLVAFFWTSLTHFVEILEIMRGITVTSWMMFFFPNPKWRLKGIRCLIAGSKCNRLAPTRPRPSSLLLNLELRVLAFVTYHENMSHEETYPCLTDCDQCFTHDSTNTSTYWVTRKIFLSHSVALTTPHPRPTHLSPIVPQAREKILGTRLDRP